MQFLKLPYELITDKNITSNEFRIYTYLLSLYNAEKDCAYPSLEVIAEKVSIGIRTVKSSIKKLVELGYMIIEKKKGINGNFNTYKEFKYLIKNVIKVTKNISVEKKEERKPLIVSDYKESGVQVEIEEIIPYTKEHQQKISLVLKQDIKLTEKQMSICNEFDSEILKDAIYNFRKSTKTNTFAFLVDCYYTSCGKYGIEPSKDIQRYCGNKFMEVSPEIIETNIALKELEIYGVECGYN